MIYSITISAIVLSACTPAAPAATQDITLIQTQSAQTVVADLTSNAPPPPTDIPTQVPPTPGADENLPVALRPTPAPGEPIAIARYNTTIYAGPGKDYVVYGAFLGGKAATVVVVAALLLAIAMSGCRREATQVTCERSIRGLGAHIGAGRIVWFGEMHGTEESPRFVGDVACLAAQRGPVQLGLEIW